MTQKRHEDCLAIIALAFFAASITISLYIVFRNLTELIP